ncbi:hypothetical protein R1flu_001810 [Riccia fluitans]|uniref:Secreted protein n=1 Tax=Riccia fluitans TaxID=41844 RepID=A0ABD1Y4U1_9MARC
MIFIARTLTFLRYWFAFGGSPGGEGWAAPAKEVVLTFLRCWFAFGGSPGEEGWAAPAKEVVQDQGDTGESEVASYPIGLAPVKEIRLIS